MSQSNGHTTAKFVSEMLNSIDSARADYRMSKDSRHNRRRTGLATGGGTGDYHSRNETAYYNDIEKARDMDRNDVMAGQILDRSAINIIQQGFSLEPMTGDNKLDVALKQRWEAEACDPDEMDIAGEMAFHDFEYAACRSMFRDGDAFIVGTEDGPYQFLESHVVKQEKSDDDVVLGVRLNDFRRKVSMIVAQDSIDPTTTKREDEVEIPFVDDEGFKQVFHIYNPKRTTSTRGVTAFAPIFEPAGMLEDINFSKLVQQNLVSCFAVFRSQQIGGPLPSTDTAYGSQSTETTASGGTRVIDGIAPGMEVIGNPGETLEGFSPNVPNSEYFQQVDLIMKLMSTSFGVPLMVLLLDASQTNFSGWRGAIDEARKGWRWHQRNQVKRFHTPAYKWRVNFWKDDDKALVKAINNEKINAFGHKWNPPAWNYIEPMKDATSDLLRLQNGLVSPTELHQERGRDFREVYQRTIKDNSEQIAAAIKEANALTKKTGETIHYLQLLSSPTPDGTTMAINVGSGGETA